MSTFDLDEEVFKENTPGNKSNSTFINYIKLAEGLKWFKPKEGEIEQIRLITVGGTFRVLVPVHFNIHKVHSVVCPTYYDEHCGLCQVRTDMYKADKEAKVPSVFSASKRNISFLIDRKHEAEGPMLYGFSAATMKLLDNQIKSLQTGVIFNVGGPDTGKDLFIKKYKKDKSIYSTINDLQLDEEGSTPLHRDPKQKADWLEFVVNNPISSMLIKKTDEEVMELYNNGPTDGGFLAEEESTGDNLSPTGETPPKLSARVVAMDVTVNTVSKPSETTGQAVSAPAPEAGDKMDEIKARIAAMRSK